MLRKRIWLLLGLALTTMSCALFPVAPALPAVTVAPSEQTPTEQAIGIVELAQPVQATPPLPTGCPTCQPCPVCAPTASPVSPTAGPTSTPVPTLTPVISTATFTSVPPTATATGKTSTPTAPPTLTTTARTPTRTRTATLVSGLYYLQKGSPVYLENFAHPAEGCNWMGIAGQVFDKSSKPVYNLVVVVQGFLGDQSLDLITLTGLAPAYGPAGYEVQLSNKVVASTNSVFISLFDLNGKLISTVNMIPTFGDCKKNLILVNFRQAK